MTTAPHPTHTSVQEGTETAPWLPLIVILLAQVQLSFNVNALPVSVGRIAEDLHVPATNIATALVVYSMFVAALVMVGAKLGRMLGERLAFQLGVTVHAFGMGMMAFSTDSRTMDNAQALAGVAAAVMVPTLVVLIAANFRGRQLALALGMVAGAQSIASALAFFIAGFLGSTLGWRYSFGLLVFLAIVVIFISFRLQSVPRQRGVKIDLTGAVLAATTIALISFGFNNLNSWGLVLAKPAAPFSPAGLSPAPFMVVIGLVMGQAFFAWTQRRVTEGRTPLLSLEVLDSTPKRATIHVFLIIGGLGPAVSFLIPLYIQIIQDRSTLFTAVAVIPYSAAIAASAMLIVRLYDWLSPRMIGVLAFVLVAVGLTLLGFTVHNDWGTPAVIGGLILTGLGEGSLLTLLFNLMVALSRRELAGDVGALRGVANNLSTALGTGFASVVAVALLGLFVTTALKRSAIPDSLKGEVDLDKVNFITNTHLHDVMAKTSATPQQVDEAVSINEEARLHALKASFLILAAISLLAIFPVVALPKHNPVLADAEPAPPDPDLVPDPSNREQ
jgi:MFS family permease